MLTGVSYQICPFLTFPLAVPHDDLQFKEHLAGLCSTRSSERLRLLMSPDIMHFYYIKPEPGLQVKSNITIKLGCIT